MMMDKSLCTPACGETWLLFLKISYKDPLRANVTHTICESAVPCVCVCAWELCWASPSPARLLRIYCRSLQSSVIFLLCKCARACKLILGPLVSERRIVGYKWHGHQPAYPFLMRAVNKASEFRNSRSWFRYSVFTSVCLLPNAVTLEGK